MAGLSLTVRPFLCAHVIYMNEPNDRKERQREADRRYYENHTEERREQWRAYYERHKESERAQAKEYQAAKRAARRAAETPEEAKERREKWNAYARVQYEKKKKDRQDKRNDLNARTGYQRTPARRAKVLAWQRKQYYTKPSYRIAQTLRDRLRHALNGAGAKKTQRTFDLIGCDVEALVRHIESQWAEGMSWENYGIGPGRWVIDHVKPCTAFRLEDEAEQRLCFHFSNLRPAFWMENLKKGSTWNGRRWRHADHALPTAAEGATVAGDVV